MRWNDGPDPSGDSGGGRERDYRGSARRGQRRRRSDVDRVCAGGRFPVSEPPGQHQADVPAVLRQRILDLTGGKGADVVYDPVGGAHTEAALRATAWRGRLLVIGFASGTIPAIKLNLALLKERSLVGVYWGDWTQRDPQGQRRNVEQLAAWFAEGRIKPVVSERVSLEEAPAATVEQLQFVIVGALIIFFLVVEPHGLARLWQIGKQKLRVWPFPY